jgi:hypothetical protein
MKLLITTMTVCALGLVASFAAQDDPNNANKKHKGQGQGQPNVTQQPATKTNRTGGQNNNQLQTGAKLHGQGQGQGKHHANVNQGTAVQGTNAGAGNGNAANNARGLKGHKNKANNANANVNNTGQTNTANNVNQGNNANQGKVNQHLSKQQLHNTPQWQANHQKAQAIHQQHLNFKAQQNPSIASVQFNKNYKIQNAQNWKGSQYVVFKNYHPQWHDQGWWHSHYHDNVFLFGGGWYYWNAGYYYPAWGYNTGQAYYPYDGPIYVGQTPQPLDQTIADVQSALQEQGFYKGDVDGLMGPLTRAALAEYQQSQGLEATAALDEPTMESLGMA